MILTALLWAATASPADTVKTYLAALERLDHAGMVALLSEDCVRRSRDEPPAPVDRAALKSFRDFERGVDTKWESEIVGVDGERVTVLQRERNAYYDLIGSGVRTQITVYVASAGRIRAIESTFSVQEHGDYQAALRAFKDWMAKQPGASSPGLFENDRLTFDAQSAPRMLPWLKEYAARNEAPR